MVLKTFKGKEGRGGIGEQECARCTYQGGISNDIVNRYDMGKPQKIAIRFGEGEK